MRVIGTAGDDVLLQATMNECAQIMGFQNRYSDGFRQMCANDVVSVHAMYDRVQAACRMKNRLSELNRMAGILQAALDAMSRPVQEIHDVAAAEEGGCNG